MIVYQEKLKVSLGMKLFWGLVALIFFLLGVLCYLSQATVGYFLCWALFVLVVVLAFALTPRKLILCEGKLEIKLYLGYTVTIPSGNIKSVSKLPKSSVFLSQDAPFKSSWSTPVHIFQKKGFAFVVTPLNPDRFVAEVSKMITGANPDSSG